MLPHPTLDTPTLRPIRPSGSMPEGIFRLLRSERVAMPF